MSRTRKLLGNVDYLSIFGSKIFEFKDLTERIKRFSLLSVDINNAPETGPFLLGANSSNAIRHFAWTYATAANYGSNAAYKTSDHHELQNDFTRRARLYAVANPGQNFTEIGYLLKTGGTLPDNLTLTRPKNMNLKDFREFVDSIADYSNNAQGIRLAEAHKKRIQGLSVISAKEAMIEAAKFYKKRGLSSIEESLNGDVAIIRQQRMSETEYNSYRTRLNQLGEDGYLPKISNQPCIHDDILANESTLIVRTNAASNTQSDNMNSIKSSVKKTFSSELSLAEKRAEAIIAKLEKAGISQDSDEFKSAFVGVIKNLKNLEIDEKKDILMTQEFSGKSLEHQQFTPS
jgi:hypothetical protein